MARPIPFLFCRYELEIDGAPLDADAQLDLFDTIKGTPVWHRKARPVETDFNTFAMMPEARMVDAHRVLAYRVGHNIRFRHQADYDRASDSLKFGFVPASGVRYETFVTLPDMGVMAVSDRTGDYHLGAAQAVSRIQSVVKNLFTGAEIRIGLDATAGDVQHALTTWNLEEFAFSVRPFNPSVKRQGEKLHEAMEEEGIGVLTGKARPMPGREMHMQEGGFIYDAVGLAESGYGQYGVRGTMPGGRPAQVQKPKFSLDRRKNEAEQAKRKVLRVFIEPQLNDTLEVEEAARALIEFYGRDSSETT